MASRLSKKSRIRILAGILCIGIIAGIAWTLFNPTESEAAWFDDNFAYRTKETIGNTGSADSNKKIKLDIDTATLISAGKMQSDCDDTRFTDINGNRLKYYLDTAGGACNTNSTDYYVLVPTINGTNDTIIYMYYGNPAASSGSEASQFSQGTFSPTSGPTAASEEKSPGPTAYWKFDDGTGSTAQDSSKNNNDGTLGASTAAPTWQTEDQCIAGKCLLFDGTNDVIQPASAIVASSATYTISGWFRTNSTTQRLIYSEGSSSSNTPMVQLSVNRTTAGDLALETRGDGGTTASAKTTGTSYNDNKWHYFSAVKGGASSFTLYVDGVSKATSTATPGTTTVSQSRIGANYQNAVVSNYFSGYLDDLKIYSYARSAAQVQSDFASRGINDGSATSIGSADPSRTLSNGLVGYWKMDETTWTNDCSTSSVLDSSGNGLNGTACPSSTGPTGGAIGKFGNAGSFDGTNDYVGLGSSSTLALTTSFTASAWVNTTATTRQIVFSSGSTDGQYWSMDLASGTARLALVNDAGTSYIANTNLTANTWNHVVIVKDGDTGTNVRLYLNGVLDGTGAAGSLSASGSKSIGSRLEAPTSNVFNGKIDDVRIYNRALSDQEVRALYDWAPGPVGYWKLDEHTGTTANDSSGNANSGTLTNNPTWTPGKNNSGVKFDNTDDYINIANSASLNITTDITLSAWIKRDGTGAYDPIIAKTDGSSFWDYELLICDNSCPGGATDTDKLAIYSDLPSTFTIVSNSKILDTNWHYVTATRSGSVVTLYIDGIASGGGTKSGAFNNNSIPIRIGSDGPTWDTKSIFNGSIDDVKIYNYARTQKQIVQDMNAAHSAVGGAKTAVGYWKFDEGQGTTANDSSGNSNSLTLNTATSSWTNTGKFGKAWDGNGANWLSRADDDDLDFAATDDFTISMWVKSDSATNPSQIECILCKTNMSSVAGYTFYAPTTGILTFGIDDDSSFQPEDTITTVADTYDGTWHNLVATKTGTSRIDLYVDGVLKSSKTTLVATGSLANSNTLYLGDRDGANNNDEFNGNIDELKIYRYALNADEIKQQYNQGSSEVMGSFSTASDGITNSSGIDRIYCVPGDTASCSGPVGEWKFDERTGSTAKDTSGNENTGTLVTTQAWSPGKENGAVDISAASSYVNIPDNSVLKITGALTVEAWIKRSDLTATTHTILVKGTRINQVVDNYGLYINGTDNLQFGVGNGTSNFATAASTTLADTNWHHVVGVFIPSTRIELYMDGLLKNTNSTSIPATLNTTTDALRIGGNSTGTEIFKGYVDTVKLYNYARSPAQISWDYNRGGPIAWYKLNECQGTTVNDSSGNGNSGTINIGATSTYTTAGTCGSGTSTHAWNGGTTGKFNQSLGFDGTDDYISIPATTSLNTLTSGLTASLWVNPSTLPAAFKRFISRGSNPSQQWEIEFNSTVGKLFYGAGASSASTGTITAGAWHHLVMTFDPTASSTKLYINGKLDSSVSGGSSLSASAAIGIGADPDGTDLYSGLVDDVRIYNYPLTLKQIQLLYNENSAVRYGPSSGAP